jgi:anti-sigma factor ChrR (cupin superfamily)
MTVFAYGRRFGCSVSQVLPKEVTMKARSVLLVTASTLLACALSAQTATSTSSATTPTFLPAGELKWTDLDPAGAPGVKIADLWGDHAKGAFGAYMKLPAGFTTPLHTHTHAMKVIFVSGTYLQTPEGNSQARLGPGSYMFQPGGNYRHVTACDKSADCVFFVESEGPFDLKPVDAKAAAK